MMNAQAHASKHCDWIEVRGEFENRIRDVCPLHVVVAARTIALNLISTIDQARVFHPLQHYNSPVYIILHYLEIQTHTETIPHRSFPSQFDTKPETGED